MRIIFSFRDPHVQSCDAGGRPDGAELSKLVGDIFEKHNIVVHYITAWTGHWVEVDLGTPRSTDDDTWGGRSLAADAQQAIRVVKDCYYGSCGHIHTGEAEVMLTII